MDGLDASMVERIRTAARTGMEQVRAEWIQHASSQPELPSEHDRLLLVKGLTERVASLLEKGGYGTLNSIVSETDLDRLSIKSGLGSQRATALQENVKKFLDDEWAGIEAGVGVAKAKADEEAERLEAETKAKAELEAAEAEKEAAAAAAAAPAAEASDESVPERPTTAENPEPAPRPEGA